MLGNRCGKRLNGYVPEYVVFDLETTGISCEKDRIVEISAVKVVNGKVVEEFSELVNPECKIPYYASRVNGITDEMVKNAAYKLAGSGFVQYPKIKVLCSILPNGKENDVLDFSTGSIIRIKGQHVSFDADDVLQGVFLVASDKTETRLTNYNRIGSCIIDAYVPTSIAAGDYEVKLVTKPGIERYEKTLFSGIITITD